MNYKRFKELVRGKEKRTVDFKLESYVFKINSLKLKGELAKDICAMANNGNVASYIIFGVSDDGLSFKSVNNEKLTDDNIQTFCKKAISPIPKVKLNRECWKNADSKHEGKIFVIIQVGPHARRAYRLNQDFISYKEFLCFRRNEVWIRRGSTSDLATPEEVSKLVQKLPLDDISLPSENTIYSRLSKDKQLNSLYLDFKKCVTEAGGIIDNNDNDRVVLKIRRLKIVLNLVLEEDINTKFRIWDITSQEWAYEHGLCIISLGSVSKSSFHPYFKINFKEDWGWFSRLDLPHYLIPKMRMEIPGNTKPASLFILTLPQIKDSITLHQSFHRMLDFLNSNDDVYKQIYLSKKQINKNLQQWLQEGWIVDMRHYFFGGGKPEKLKKDEIFNKRRFGSRLMKRIRNPLLERNAKKVLLLS